MNVFMKGQTHSAVHSQRAMEAQRQGEGIRNQFILSALHLYAQVVIGLAFYLYGHVSTPGYMSVLLLLFPLAGAYGISLWLRKKKGLMEGPWGRAAHGLLFLCLLSDAQMSLYAFVEIVREMLPDYNSALIALVTLLCVLPALQKQHSHALPSLARLMKFPLLMGLGFCLVGGAAQGSGQHLFPLFGMEGKRIFSGAAWMTSTLSAALSPLYLHQPPATLKQKKQGMASLAAALLLGSGTAFLSAFMMPFYFLARPDTMGTRLLLALKVNPGLMAWSVMVCLMLLLFLISLACALSRGRHALGHMTQRSFSPWFFLLLVPLPALATDRAHQLLCLWAPMRTVLMGAVLGILAAGALMGRGKKGA